MGHICGRLTLACLVSLLVGCLQPDLIPCGEKVCSAEQVCTPGGCAVKADVDACAGFADGDACTTSLAQSGTCVGGSCKTGLCGNGTLDPGEVCDDHNRDSGDGCRADCQKVEMCGDGVVDANEACDDGNTNASDGCDQCMPTMWQVSVGVGGPMLGTSTELRYPNDVAIDFAGHVFIADSNNNRIRRLDPDGTMTVVAGTGAAGYSGDGGPASSAQLMRPFALALDGLGRMYFTDSGNHVVRRIDADGTISTIAGTHVSGYAGDGGPATAAKLNSPYAIALDTLGRVYIGDGYNNRIRRIELDGTITTIAGTGTSGAAGDNGPAIAAQVSVVFALEFDPEGRLLIADTSNYRVRRIDTDGVITTIAGTGNSNSSGDGGPAISASLTAYGVAADGTGGVLIADYTGRKIRRVGTDGIITSIAGNGTYGYAGDGGPATAAMLAPAGGIAIDNAGQVVFADSINQCIRRIDTAGIITTIAGTGLTGLGDEGGPASGASIRMPWGVATDSMGRLIIADTYTQRILRIETDGTLKRLGGVGQQGFSGDGGPATSAKMFPWGVAVDAMDNIYFADRFNNRIRKIDTAGIITTVAGSGVGGFGGDQGPATLANLDNPFDVAIDGQGRLFVADYGNRRIRRVDVDGTIHTVAGGGSQGLGDNGDATLAQLTYPMGVAVDSTGQILIGDISGRVRRVDTNGIITTIAGGGSGGDGGPATAAALSWPAGVGVDAMDRPLIAERDGARIRRIETDGTISTIAGNGLAGFAGDGGTATNAEVHPARVMIDRQGRVVFADTENNMVRRIESDGSLYTVVGHIDPNDVIPGAITRARVGNAVALASTPSMKLLASGTSGTIEALFGSDIRVVAGRYPQPTATSNLARFRDAGFGSIGGLAIDPVTGTIYISETTANRVHAITPVDPANPLTWTIEPIINPTSIPGFADGDAATTAQLRAPKGLWLDVAARILYIADSGNSSVRALNLASNIVTTIANTSHTFGASGDGGDATLARLCQPAALTKCGNGDLFVADTCNNRIRRISGGIITTVLGDGVPASSGEGSPARDFPIDAPAGVACDAVGNVFASSTMTVRLLPADPDGIVDGSGEVQTIYGKPPRTTFPVSQTRCLSGLLVTSATSVEVADSCTGLVLELSRVAAP